MKTLTRQNIIEIGHKHGLPDTYPLCGNKAQIIQQTLNCFNRICDYTGICHDFQGEEYEKAKAKRDEVRAEFHDVKL